MRRFTILIMAICLASTITAQDTLPIFEPVAEPVAQNTPVQSSMKLDISPSYGFVAMAHFTEPAVNISVGYNITYDLRVSLRMGYAFGRTSGAFNIAGLIGSTELYMFPSNRNIYSDIAFGLGYQDNPVIGGFAYFPIRYRTGYIITKNITAGVEALAALTTKREGIFMGGLGIFFSLRF